MCKKTPAPANKKTTSIIRLHFLKNEVLDDMISADIKTEMTGKTKNSN
ncbi:hypothetical protein GCM10009114_37190 [Aliiglaciecola litoralis]|uniref:Uncharacterized protein n=1 Tax=Aliiglaciecola litoralis TaxID=582857 RepID=A0ABP3X668_9ALTE